LDFTASCAPQTVTFEVVDVNDNPMPPGTTITATQVTNATVGAASPAAVPMWNLGALGVGQVSHRGTVHTIAVTPPAACNTGGGTLHTTDSFFNLTFTSPLAGVASTVVTLQYKS